jgi:hypothetical protein
LRKFLRSITNQKLEIGNWKLENGNWKFEGHNCYEDGRFPFSSFHFPFSLLNRQSAIENRQLEVARGAIHGRLFQLVAIQAKTHVHIHGADGHCPLRHVAVASLAFDPGANVGSVIELHMSRGTVIVNSLPGNIFATRQVGGHLLNLRFVGGDHLVARHAELDAGDAGDRAFGDVRVAIGAIHPIRQMNFM